MPPVQKTADQTDDHARRAERQQRIFKITVYQERRLYALKWFRRCRDQRIHKVGQEGADVDKEKGKQAATISAK